MGSPSSFVSFTGVDILKVAITLAFLILFTTLSPCLAQESVDLSASVAEPPITPVIVGGGRVDYEVLGAIVADMWLDFFKDIVSRGDILSTLVTIVNTEMTYNDVLLKGEIMSVDETVTYTQVAESLLRIGYGTNQKQLDINVPDLKAGDYLFRVSMIEPNGDVTIALKVFTVKMCLFDIITDLRVIAALLMLILVLYLYLTKEKTCQTQAN